MAADLSAGELAQALAALDRIGDELAEIGTWLAGLDHDRPSIMLQDACSSISSAGWELSRPLRAALQRARASVP